MVFWAVDVGLSSPGGGELYLLDGPADEEELAWRMLESGDSGDEGMDSEDDADLDLLFPGDGFSWCDAVRVRAGVSGASPFRWLGG